MKRPSVKIRREMRSNIAANQVIEFAGADGVGGLIDVRQLENGGVTVSLYRLDRNVEVTVQPMKDRS